MGARSLLTGLCVLLVVTTAARAYLFTSMERVYVSGYRSMAERVGEIDSEALSGKRVRNLAKARERLGREPRGLEDLLRSLESSVKPLARALDGTPDQEAVEKRIVDILTGLSFDISGFPDELEARLARDDDSDGLGQAMRLSKVRARIRKLVRRARALIGASGGGIDADGFATLGDKGKALKRRARALRKAVEKLGEADEKLVTIGL